MLKKFNYSLLFLAILLVRNTIKGSDIGDAIALTAIAALYGYSVYLDSKRELIANADIKRDIEQLKSSVDSLKIARVMNRSS